MAIGSSVGQSSRIGTYSNFRTTIRNVQLNQSNLFSLQEQISSGYKAKNFAGLDGNVEQFTQLEAKISNTKTYENNNEVTISRLKTMNVSITQIIDTADKMEDLMALRRNGAVGGSLNFGPQIKNHLDSIASELNSTFEGRYIFAGTKTNVPPVIVDPAIPQPITTGVPDSAYYQGSNENITYRANDNTTIEQNVKANNPAFQKMFAAVRLAQQGDAEDDDAKIADALTMMQDALKDVTAIQAEVNTNVINLESINERHQDLRLYWTGVTENISKTDILEASTQIAVDQAVLQASFQSFARISQLKLSDFL